MTDNNISTPSINTNNSPSTQATESIDLPQDIIETFARFLVPELQKYYQSEEGKLALANWENDSSSK